MGYMEGTIVMNERCPCNTARPQQYGRPKRDEGFQQKGLGRTFNVFSDTFVVGNRANRNRARSNPTKIIDDYGL